MIKVILFCFFFLSFFFCFFLVKFKNGETD